jgi:hypothetical protein
MKVFAAVMVSLSLAAAVQLAWAQEEVALLADTRKTALPVLPKVVQAMQTAVSEQGPVGAIPVCKEKAPQLLQDMRRQTGWNIRRVSLKSRNPATGTPDAWETRQLAGFNIQFANGAKPEQLEVGEVVTAPDGKRSYRYMKALPVVEVCLSCHGTVDSLSADLRTALARDYPHDRATGYATGQVRGALSVIRPL